MAYTAYCLGLRKNVTIKDPALVLMKNGRYSVKGVAQENPKYKVSRILRQDEIADAKKNLPSA